MSKIQPLENRVLVEPIRARESKGGILLPQSAQEKPREGKVLAVGPGKRSESGQLQKVEVREGDVVSFSTYSGTEFSLEDRQYLILAEDEILGILL